MGSNNIYVFYHLAIFGNFLAIFHIFLWSVMVYCNCQLNLYTNFFAIKKVNLVWFLNQTGSMMGALVIW